MQNPDDMMDRMLLVEAREQYLKRARISAHLAGILDELGMGTGPFEAEAVAYHQRAADIKTYLLGGSG